MAADMTQSPRSPAVVARGLHKRFRTVNALDGLDLTIRSRGVYAILGPNGAGKTTLIRVLATLVRPDSGQASVMGLDVASEAAEVRRRISLTGQFASVDADLSGRENLALLGALLGLTRRQAHARCTELLAGFGLADAGDRPVRTYSGGMRRRLDVAASIIVTPELLFLDEPTTGLDPRSRYQVWEMVRRLVSAGTTVLLTTQYLDEADQLADRIGVIDHGRLVAEGTPSELKAGLRASSLEVRLLDSGQTAQAAAVLAALDEQKVETDRDRALLRVTAIDPSAAARTLLELDRAGVALASFTLGQATLDEVFLDLIDGHPDTRPKETAA